MQVTAYTDGASSPQKEHGIGGWGFCMFTEGVDCEIRQSGYEKDTTNQRMEMLAIIKALRTATQLSDKPVNVLIVSDSRYCIDGITQWSHNWKRNGWRKSGGEIKNLDLWKRMYDLVYNKHLVVEFKWVKGHSGDHYNDIADELATSAKKEGIEEHG